MPRPLRSTGLVWLWIALLVCSLDALSKQWALTQLTPHEPFVITHWLNFLLAFNTGAAFSLLQTASGWQNAVLGSVAALISLGLLIWLYYLSYQDRLLNISLSMMIGGACGNLLDRVAYGHVIDFIDLHIATWHWPIFNLADASVFIGACLVSWYWSRVRS